MFLNMIMFIKQKIINHIKWEKLNKWRLKIEPINFTTHDQSQKF